ncbi:MAG TPA: hypothetical protein VIQ76_21515 [Propionibacteriaceae bacterium]
MRWDNLFDDLESQLEQGLTAEEIDLQAEEERLRLGRLGLRERIAAILQAQKYDPAYRIRVTLRGGEGLSLRPVAIGKDWLSADLLDDSTRRAQCVLPLRAIAGVILTPSQVQQSLAVTASADSEPGITSRLGLTFVLRDLCRRRREVGVHLADGDLHGTIDRVGRDHFDLAIHDPGAARRDSAVVSYRIIPLDHILLVLL